ncbi:MAG: thioesterase [Candidatus Faecousia sp.]|nr:thioesterase [Bacillota bacterium]MDY4754846.1 thioesterase [Candidatus Faecousia sp.]MDY6161514.1 thioesterase [Candidatus Faecousia sp.]
MEPIYVQNITVEDAYVDCFGRMKPSMMLYLAQEMGGRHSALMSLDYDTLASQRLFWAVIRHRVQVTRVPTLGETLRMETWPLPTTRSAFPRNVVAYDAKGNEVFRCITLWVLMDLDTRKMILPGKSGIVVAGTIRGNELPAPGGLIPKPLGVGKLRTVSFTDLDRNGHMNNTKCMDWIADLLPSQFHKSHTVTDFTVCYLAEAREQQELRLNWDMSDGCILQVDASTGTGEDAHRVFSAKLLFDNSDVL